MNKCLVDFSTVGIYEMSSAQRSNQQQQQSEWEIVGTSPNNLTILLSSTLLQLQGQNNNGNNNQHYEEEQDSSSSLPAPDAILVFVSNTYPQGACTFVALSMMIKSVGQLKHSDINTLLTTSIEQWSNDGNSGNITTTAPTRSILQLTPGTRPYRVSTRTCPIHDAFEEALGDFCETMTTPPMATTKPTAQAAPILNTTKDNMSSQYSGGGDNAGEFGACVQCGKPSIAPSSANLKTGPGGGPSSSSSQGNNAINKDARRRRKRGESRSTINWDVVQNALRLLHTHLGDPELLCHPEDKSKLTPATATSSTTDDNNNSPTTRRSSNPPQQGSNGAATPSELEPERRRSPSCGSAFDPTTNRIIVSVGVPLGDMGALLRKSLGLPPSSSSSQNNNRKNGDNNIHTTNYEKYLVTWFSYPPSYTLPVDSAVNTVVVVGDRVANSNTSSFADDASASSPLSAAAGQASSPTSFGSGGGVGENEEIEYGFKDNDDCDHDTDLLLLEKETIEGVAVGGMSRRKNIIGAGSSSSLPYPVVVATYVAARCDININKINHVLHSDRYRNQPPSTEHFESQMSGDDRVKDRVAKKPTDQYGCQKVFGALPWLLSNRLNIASRKNYKMKQLADTKDRLELEISELLQLHRQLINNTMGAYMSSSARKTQLDSTIGKIDALKLQLAEVDASLSRIQSSFSMPEAEAHLFSYHNPIVGLQQAVSRRLIAVTSRCVICDRRMGFAALRISACDRDSCRYSFENLGIGVDVIHELTSNPVVCELLISLALASIRTGITLGRDTFDPMCTIRISQEDAEDYCRVEERNFLDAFATSWVVNDELKRRYKEAQSRLTQLSTRADKKRAELTNLEISLGSTSHPLIALKRHKLAVLTKRVGMYRESIAKRFRMCLVGQGGPLDSSTAAHMSEVIEYSCGSVGVGENGGAPSTDDPNFAQNIDRLLPSGIFSSPWQVPVHKTVRRSIAERQKAITAATRQQSATALPLQDKFSLNRFPRTILCGRISKNCVQLYTMMDSVFGVRRGSISHGIQHLLTVDEVADLKLEDLLRPLEAGLYGDDRDSVSVSRLHNLHTICSDVVLRKKAYIQAQLSNTMRVFMTGTTTTNHHTTAASGSNCETKRRSTTSKHHQRHSLYDNSYNTIKKGVPLKQEDVPRPSSPNFSDGGGGGVLAVDTDVNRTTPETTSSSSSSRKVSGGGVRRTQSAALSDIGTTLVQNSGIPIHNGAVGTGEVTRTESPNTMQRLLGASHARYTLSKLLEMQTQLLHYRESNCGTSVTSATSSSSLSSNKRCMKALRTVNSQIRKCATVLGVPAIEIEMLVSFNTNIRPITTISSSGQNHQSGNVDEGEGTMINSSSPSQGDFWGDTYRPTQVVSPVTSNSGIGGFPVPPQHPLAHEDDATTITASGITSRHLSPTVSALLQPDAFPLQTVVNISRTQSKHGHGIPKALHQQLARSEWTTTPPSMLYQFLYTGAEHFFGDVYNGSIKSLKLLETTIESIPPISQMLEKAYDTSKDQEILQEWERTNGGCYDSYFDDTTTSCSTSSDDDDVENEAATKHHQRLYNNDDHYENSYGTPSGSFSAPPPMMAGVTDDGGSGKRGRRGTIAATATPPMGFQKQEEHADEEEIHFPPQIIMPLPPPPPPLCACCQNKKSTTNNNQNGHNNNYSNNTLTSRSQKKTSLSVETEALIQTLLLEDGGGDNTTTTTLLDPASNEDDIFVRDANLKYTGRVRADLNPLWVEKLGRGTAAFKGSGPFPTSEFSLRGVGSEEVGSAVRTPSMSTAAKTKNPWKPNQQSFDNNTNSSARRTKRKQHNNTSTTPQQKQQLQVTALTRLRRFLGEKDPLLFPLLQWIIASNRVHIEPLPFHLKLEALNDLSNGGCFQFYVVADNPEKEMKFQQHKRRARERLEAEIGPAKVQALLAKNASIATSRNASNTPQTVEDRTKSPTGSFFAWHASSPGNWHSILRHGLKNFSGTHMMSTGQVFGAGIYTATTLPVCMSYAGSTQNFWSGTTRLVGTGMSCLSLVEVASASHGWKEMASHILTIQDEELLCTRFLFVFPSGINPESVAAALQVKFPANFLHRFSEEHCAVF